MSFPSIQNSFSGGEWSPALFGRTDLAKYRSACSTVRNFQVNYRGGVNSRAGTKFVGISAQGRGGHADTALPSRLIPFQFSVDQGLVIEAGEFYFRFISRGAFITNAPAAITGISLGTATVVTAPAHGFGAGFEIFLFGIGGTIGLNNQSFTIINVTTDTFTLQSMLDGTAVDSSNMPAYTSGGTAANIYSIATPYTAAELPLLKFVQSADVMTFVHHAHPPYNLTRISATNWTLLPINFTGSIAAPSGISVTETNAGGTASFYYQFVATAVSAETGEESIASPVGTVLTIDQAITAGSIFVTCTAVAGAGSYNFYGSPVSYLNPPTSGSLFGYVGTAFGPQFTDTNVVPDFTTAPPLHTDPFATSSLIAVTVTAPGATYSVTATTATVTSPIGRNPVLVPIIPSPTGGILAVSVQSGGAGFTGGEAVVFTDATGSGSGATATLTVGPATGTWPGVVAYFQQRRFYANTLNNPDTYFASQPGAFDNMDTSLPVQADDAITGSPWSQQVNGIQWMLNMPGGLIVFTGLGAWQVNGGGGGVATATPITPSAQVATPQAFNGINNRVGPIVINYNILYVQQKGSIVRDLSYNIYANIYTGTDLTLFSSHLFATHQIVEWAWAEEPNKLVWAVRDDGTLLSLTYLKEQEVNAWARHDTNGLFQSVCSVSEPPINATYFVVKRLIRNSGNPVWVYCLERMDDRLWTTVEDAWCVDCGLTLPQTEPAATLTLSSAQGVPTLMTPSVTYGGAGYGPNTYARIDDPTGEGALLTLTIVAGVVTAVALAGTTTGYTAPVVVVVDPDGLGGNAVILLEVNALATATTSAAVFANTAGHGEAGDVIRMGGRVMRVTQYVDAREVQTAVIRDDSQSVPDDPFDTPVPTTAGNWTIAAPVTTVYGLGHLEGMVVSILADGVVVTPQVVADGMIILPVAASLVTVGLGFRAQLQTLYLDVPGGVTVQGRRKTIDNVVVRLEASAMPFEVGTNQPDASTLPGGEEPWTDMTLTETPSCVDEGVARPLQPWELYTGDQFANVNDRLGFDRGQMAVQQTAPVPLNISALVLWAGVGDDPDA